MEEVPSSDPVAPVRPRRHTARWISAAVAAVTVGLVVVLVTRAPASSKVAPSPMIGRVAPEVVGTSIDGEVFDLGSQRGRWVVVNFFATWCVPCRKEHPELVKLAEAHADTGDVALVGVIYDDQVEAVRKFRDRFGGTWPMLPDQDGSIGLSFGITGVPETFLIAPDGTVVYRILGGVVAKDLESLLAS